MKPSASAAFVSQREPADLSSSASPLSVGKVYSVKPWRTVMLSLAALLLIILVVDEVVYWQLRHQLRTKQTPNALLASIRQMEGERLNQYRFVRKSEGVVRIPLSRARELVLQDYAHSNGLSQAGALAASALPEAQ